MTTMHAAAWAAALTALVALLLRALSAVEEKLLTRLAAARPPELRIQRLVLLSAEQTRATLESALGATRFLASLALVLYFYLPALFGLFPETRGFETALWGWLLAPLKIIARGTLDFIPNLIFIAVTLLVVRYALRLLHLIFDEVGKGRLHFPGFYADWAEPTWQIARILMVAFTAVVIFPYLPGSDSPAFKGISVFLGVLLSLGSGSAISNAVSGAIMTYMRPFGVGDRVEIAGTSGDVIERTLLVTRVRTIKNEEVTIPNALILGAHIVNYTAGKRNGGLILHTAVTIGYDAPWRKVHELLVAAAKGTEGILAHPAPFVLQTALGDYSVSYEINAYTDRPAEMVNIYSALHARIQDAFAAAGVEIMSPQYIVRRTGPDSTIPKA